MTEARRRYGFKLYNVNTLQLKSRDYLPFASLVTYDGRKAMNMDELKVIPSMGVCMDSGAFPAYKKNIDLDLGKYIQYVLDCQDHLDWFAQLDYIPRQFGGKTEDLQRYASDETWIRYKEMHETPGMDISKLAFIAHGQSSIENDLVRALSWRSSKTGRGVEMLAVGLSFSDRFLRDKQLSIAERVIKEFNFTGKFHALGMQDKELYVKYPFITSADSSSAIKDTISGTVFIDGVNYKVLDDEKLSHKSALSAKQRELQVEFLKKKCEEHGRHWEIAHEQTGYLERFIWDCQQRTEWFVPKECRNG